MGIILVSGMILSTLGITPVLWKVSSKRSHTVEDSCLYLYTINISVT